MTDTIFSDSINSGRGSFVEKASRVVNAGAIALVIINTSDALVSPTTSGIQSTLQNLAASITIPVVCVRASDSKQLLEASGCKLVYRRIPEPFVPRTPDEPEANESDGADDLADLCSKIIEPEWLAAAFEGAGVPPAQSEDAARRAGLALGPRLRRLAAGHFSLKPASYSIYTLQSPEQRVRFDVAKPTAVWWNRL